ncbi:hypothetical protein Pyrfu_1173 [Pyrolobus fumarii 1A]|uniref:Uncharacterized protein n=1 Tax=Pyrolobus fumarii (strain DSM 11204 / 1A) TaxID=694429 RepID=G0EFL2_PYRF1|nr:hypothetical protein Pyrfu_1173 [Pyrolobus fumarii 1A]
MLVVSICKVKLGERHAYEVLVRLPTLKDKGGLTITTHRFLVDAVTGEVLEAAPVEASRSS